MVVHANDQVAWIGLRTESGRSTSTSSRTTPESSWLWICAEYQDVNWVFHKLFCSINNQIIFRWRWVVRFSAGYIHVKSLQITFADHTWQDAKWSLPGNNFFFMSIHKLHMSLLIMFIKFFLWFKFLTMVFNFARIFIREALISRFFCNRENREIKDARNFETQISLCRYAPQKRLWKI